MAMESRLAYGLTLYRAAELPGQVGFTYTGTTCFMFRARDWVWPSTSCLGSGDNRTLSDCDLVIHSRIPGCACRPRRSSPKVCPRQRWKKCVGKVANA